jgi:hypothetical protein
LVSVQLKPAGKQRFEFREARYVLRSPPTRRDLTMGPLVLIQPNVHVAVWVVIPSHATSKKIDGMNSRRWLDPVGHDLGQSFQFVHV